MIEQLADKLRRTYIANGGAVTTTNEVDWHQLKPEVQRRWQEVAREALRFQGQLTTIEVPYGSEITIIHKGISPMPTDLGVTDLKSPIASSPEVVHTSNYDPWQLRSKLSSLAGLFENSGNFDLIDKDKVKAKVEEILSMLKA